MVNLRADHIRTCQETTDRVGSVNVVQVGFHPLPTYGAPAALVIVATFSTGL